MADLSLRRRLYGKWLDWQYSASAIAIAARLGW